MTCLAHLAIGVGGLLLLIKVMVRVASNFVSVEGSCLYNIFVAVEVDLLQFGKARRDYFGLCQPILLLLLFIYQLLFTTQE